MTRINRQTDNRKELQQLTKMSHLDLTKNLRSLSKKDIFIQIEIMERHKNILYKLKEKYPETSLAVISLSALQLAIKSFAVQEKQLLNLNFYDLSLDEIKDLSLIQITKIKSKRHRSAPKRERLLELWPVVKQARNEGLSFANICTLLQSRQLKVSVNFICKIWHELETDNQPSRKNGN